MRFVIVVDAQRDFMAANGALSVAGADALIGPLDDWLATLLPQEVAGVLFTFDTHSRETYPGSAEAAMFPIHCVRGEAGWQSVLHSERTSAAIPLWRLEKGVFAMWEEPELRVSDFRDPAAAGIDRDAFFADLRTRGIDEVTVVGVAADYCVRWAVDGLLARGFRVTVVASLTRGIERGMAQVAAEEFAGQAVTIA